MAAGTTAFKHPIMDMLLFCGQYTGGHIQNNSQYQHSRQQHTVSLFHAVHASLKNSDICCSLQQRTCLNNTIFGFPNQVSKEIKNRKPLKNRVSGLC
jgi:hypothetical protein